MSSLVFVIFRKEMRELRNTKTLLLAILLYPLIIVALLFRDYLLAAPRSEILAQAELLVPFVGFLLPLSVAGVLSMDSFVGERNRRTIEPLLASPISERELFLGKVLSALVPSLLITYVFVFGFSGALSLIEPTLIGVVFTASVGVRIFWQAPVLALLSTCVVTVVSCKVSDTRVAMQVANYVVLGLVFFSFFEFGFFGDSLASLVLVTSIFSVIDLVLLMLSNRFYKREELMKRM